MTKFAKTHNPKGSDQIRRRPMTKRRVHINDVNFAHHGMRIAMAATDADARMYWVGLAKSTLNWASEGRVAYPAPKVARMEIWQDYHGRKYEIEIAFVRFLGGYVIWIDDDPYNEGEPEPSKRAAHKELRSNFKRIA